MWFKNLRKWVEGEYFFNLANLENVPNKGEYFLDSLALWLAVK